MSILIKGVDMPKDCLSCPCMVSDCEGDMCAFQSYEKNATFEDWEQMKASCPPVPVPTPHGRLIDADALFEVMTTEYKRIAETYGENDEYALCLKNYAISMVTSAPTIIEAEEGGIGNV